MEKRILLIAAVLVVAAFLAHSYESNLQRLTGQQISELQTSFRTERSTIVSNSFFDRLLGFLGVTDTAGGNSGGGPLGGGQHNNHPGPQYTEYFPSYYKHNNVPGPHQTIIHPPNERHNPIAGPDVSKLFHEDFVHNPIAGPHQSQMFLNTWEHRLSGEYMSEMWPPGPLPPKSIQPKPPTEPRTDRKHVEEGPAKTNWIPHEYKHISVGSPTNWVPPDSKHVEEGPEVTFWVAPDRKHVTNEYGSTHWTPPEWKHVDEGPEKTRWIPPSFKHIETGSDKTKWEYPDKREKKPADQ